MASNREAGSQVSSAAPQRGPPPGSSSIWPSVAGAGMAEGGQFLCLEVRVGRSGGEFSLYFSRCPNDPSQTEHEFEGAELVSVVCSIHGGWSVESLRVR